MREEAGSGWQGSSGTDERYTSGLPRSFRLPMSLIAGGTSSFDSDGGGTFLAIIL